MVKVIHDVQMGMWADGSAWALNGLRLVLSSIIVFEAKMVFSIYGSKET